MNPGFADSANLGLSFTAFIRILFKIIVQPDITNYKPVGGINCSNKASDDTVIYISKIMLNDDKRNAILDPQFTEHQKKQKFQNVQSTYAYVVNVKNNFCASPNVHRLQK